MFSDSSNNSFSKLATALVDVFENKEVTDSDKKITVNILVSKVAFWYEKLRTAMDYGTEETILRRAIERILKRRLILDADGKSLAEILVRELVWAGYFADATVPESIIDKVASSVSLHLRLKNALTAKKILGNENVSEFVIQLLSCDIYTILLPGKEKEAMGNFMFQILKNSVNIEDDTEQTKDVQVFIAVRKNFARDDIAFLRYKLFTQIFGRLSEDNLSKTIASFANGYKEINYQLSYPKKDKIFNHIKKKTPPFLILYDILMEEKGHIKTLAKSDDDFKTRVFSACNRRYKNINKKVKTAIIRSFVFILFTKAFVALFIEGTFEKLFLGQIQWLSIVLNTTIPPFLMVLAGLGIKTPDSRNSQIIFLDIQRLLLEENPKVSKNLSLRLKSTKPRTIRNQIFSVLWLLSILLVFGLIGFGLTKLHFNLLSQGIFLFFIAIVSFLTYRIYQTASIYTVVTGKQTILNPIVDFFFVPIVRVGRNLTEGISQINFTLIIIDYIIEAPFKGFVGFFEQWFLFLATKREELE